MDYSEKLVVKGLKEGDTEAYQYIFDTHYQCSAIQPTATCVTALWQRPSWAI